MDKANPSLLLARLIELEELLQSPAGEYDVKHVDALIMFIARRAPNPSIRGIAMLAMAEVNTLRRNTLAEQDRRKLNMVLHQLRGAIEEVEKQAG
jgi:hypothetical protein